MSDIKCYHFVGSDIKRLPRKEKKKIKKEMSHWYDIPFDEIVIKLDTPNNFKL